MPERPGKLKRVMAAMCGVCPLCVARRLLTRSRLGLLPNVCPCCRAKKEAQDEAQGQKPGAP